MAPEGPQEGEADKGDEGKGEGGVGKENGKVDPADQSGSGEGFCADQAPPDEVDDQKEGGEDGRGEHGRVVVTDLPSPHGGVAHQEGKTAREDQRGVEGGEPPVKAHGYGGIKTEYLQRLLHEQLPNPYTQRLPVPLPYPQGLPAARLTLRPFSLTSVPGTPAGIAPWVGRQREGDEAVAAACFR